jgi:4-hydroxybenzoate polyprenyltransferase
MGAWIAIRGAFSLPPILLSAAVAFWLLGFDILYSLQDRDFDVSVGLQSLPAKIGNKAAIAVSRVGHVVMVAFLIAFGATAGLHAIAGVAISASLIAYEQSLVRHDDLSRLGFAFFNVNGYISVAFFLITAADVMLRHIM